jgi:hypothetical protein
LKIEILRKSGHIYFLLSFLCLLFFSKSSFASVDKSAPVKKQTFEIKTPEILLSDFEDSNEYQNKTRFDHNGSIPFTIIKRVKVSFPINYSGALSGARILSSSQKRSLTGVFRL